MKQFPGNGQSVRFFEAPVVVRKGGKEDEEKVTYSVSVSSEYPVERSFWGMRWREVLDHSAEAVQMDRFSSGRAAVLEEHRGAPVGVARGWLDNKERVLRADVRFSRSVRARELQQDVDDSIRTNISVGYIPKRAVLVEEDDEKGDLWRVTLWEPVELSFVGVPADPTVGFGRANDGAAGPPVVIEGSSAAKEEQMKKVRSENGAVIEVADDDPRPAIPAEVRSAPPDNEMGEMLRLADAYGYGPAKVQEWVRDGLSIRNIMDGILKDRVTKGNVQPAAESLTDLGVPKRDIEQYRYQRAILGAALIAEGKPWSGVEADVHRHLETVMPSTVLRRGGVLVPMRLSNDLHPSARALSSNATGKGAEVVFEQAGELIELLRNRTAVLALGARLLTGLTSPIAFPKQTAAMVATWVGENPGGDVADSDLVLGLALLAPKTLQASTAYSRQLLMQSSIDVEAMVRDELAIVHAIAMDRAAIHGLAAAGEPTGVYKAVGVNSKAFGGAASYSLLLDMQGEVALDNADLGTLGYIMNPTMATNLRKLLDFPAAAAGRPIWTGTYQSGEVGGYRAVATNQVSNTMTGSERVGGSEIGAVFGNWNDLIIGGFGGLELIVDPYRLKKQGIIEVTSFQMADTLVRHGESFCKSTGATA